MVSKIGPKNPGFPLPPRGGENLSPKGSPELSPLQKLFLQEVLDTKKEMKKETLEPILEALSQEMDKKASEIQTLQRRDPTYEELNQFIHKQISDLNKVSKAQAGNKSILVAALLGIHVMRALQEKAKALLQVL